MKKNSNIMQFNKNGKVKFIEQDTKQNKQSKIVIEVTGEDDLLVSILNCNLPDVMDMVASAMNTFFSQSDVCQDQSFIANMLKSDFCLQFMNAADLTIDDLVHFIANQAISSFIKDHNLEDMIHDEEEHDCKNCDDKDTYDKYQESLKEDKKKSKKTNNEIKIDIKQKKPKK